MASIHTLRTLFDAEPGGAGAVGAHVRARVHSDLGQAQLIRPVALSFNCFIQVVQVSPLRSASDTLRCIVSATAPWAHTRQQSTNRRLYARIR